jgi:hypothetical protein
MNYWIVKGRPAENEFEAWLRPGRPDRWRTAAPPADWKPGDRLFFWKSSPDLCVVGLGELVQIGRRQPRGRNTMFGVQYLTPMLTRPVDIESLRRDRVMRHASFLKPGPATALHRISDAQGRRLYALARRANSFVADVWPDLAVPTPQVPDIDLIDATDEGARRLVPNVRRDGADA